MICNGQSKRMSFLECLVNVAIGYGIAVIAQMLIFPLFGLNAPLRDNLMIGAIFTVISIVRSFCLRRLFNWLHVRRASREVDDGPPVDSASLSV